MQTGSPGQFNEEQWRVIGLKRPSYKTLLGWLFLRPHLAVFYLRSVRIWKRSALLLFILLAVGGGVKAMIVFPEFMGHTIRIAKAVSGEVGYLGVKDGRLFWGGEFALPHTIYAGECQADFYDVGQQPLTAQLLKGSSRFGLIFTSTDVRFWIRDFVNGGTLRKATLADEKSFRTFEERLAKKGVTECVMDQEKIILYAQAGCIMALPLIAAYYFCELFFPVLLCMVIFIGVVLCFNRNWRMAKKELFSLCVHFCIPPLIAGMGYAFVNVPWLDFQTLYMILFLVYLYFVYINLKRFISDSLGQNMP